MVATVDLMDGVVLGETRAYGGRDRHRNVVLRKVYDARITPAGAGDILELISIPERFKVNEVYVEVTRVEGGAATFNVGDTASATQYLAAVDANALSAAVSLATAAKLYGVDSDIRITTVNAIDECQVVVCVTGVDYANDLPVKA